MEGSDLDIHRAIRARRIHVEHGANGEGEKLAWTLQGVQAGRIHADTALTMRGRNWRGLYRRFQEEGSIQARH
jgi:hypothetical protein